MNLYAAFELEAMRTRVARRPSDEFKRSCWVCFASDEDEPSFPWVQPCNCKGTTKWVHQYCLQRWVDEKQKGNLTKKISCPQCNMDYMIVFPGMGFLVRLLDSIDFAIYKVCPFFAAGMVIGAIYWTAATYGAVTLMQVYGHKEAVKAMQGVDVLVLLVGLPMIPIVLILGKMIKWEDALLGFVRRHSQKIPILRHVLPSQVQVGYRSQTTLPPLTNSVSATRVFCSALLLPTVATICGKVFFDHLPSNLQKTCMGGLAFLAVKGLLKIYHKQQEYIRRSQRKILDYIPNNGNAPPDPPQ
uniref:E3 ubiquitin-protein ligase MARCHF5 n=1 Tax=Clastoptera arizonana TaxID=38151 RepID=A0A1B6D7M9_9HEMI